jgi:HAD superfamily hydrolase (TIGR01509 family)
MTYQGMIFDFNGVLWWDSHLQEQAWREFAEELFGISLTDADMALEVHGRNNKHTLEFLAGTPLDPQQVKQLSDQKERLYRELCLAEGDGFRLSPGAIELLDALRDNGIPRTIATASGEENIMFFIEHLNLESWFDADQILYDDGSRPGKPAPDIYLQSAERLGLLPGECVVVEDSKSGIQAARSAGIGYIIAMLLDEKKLVILNDKVDLVVENLAQIPCGVLFNKSE